MFAIWLKLVTILFLSCTAQSDKGSSRVVWKKKGEAITIQCSYSQESKENLSLKKGLHEEFEIINTIDFDRQLKKDIIANAFRDRLQMARRFPYMEILITNLTSEDTGPYWCLSTKFDMVASKVTTMKGNGSVVLVVTDDQECGIKQPFDLVPVYVMVSFTLLSCVILLAIIWRILKTRTLHNSGKQRRVPKNDVYEDMRGTLRH